MELLQSIFEEEDTILEALLADPATRAELLRGVEEPPAKRRQRIGGMAPRPDASRCCARDRSSALAHASTLVQGPPFAILTCMHTHGTPVQSMCCKHSSTLWQVAEQPVVEHADMCRP
jgi:hypothetical protein